MGEREGRNGNKEWHEGKGGMNEREKEVERRRDEGDQGWLSSNNVRSKALGVYLTNTVR